MNSNKNPNFKSGVKTLTDTQIKNGLPGYDLLKDKIETIRANAKSVTKLDGESFENLKYDNIFSILGGRGAGKTSILFTLYDYLKTSQKQSENILMPLIMPELIDNNDNFIGWILAAVGQNLNEVEGRISNLGYRDDTSVYGQICRDYDFFKRCVFNKQNKLRSAYEDLKKAYYSKNYSDKVDEQDYSADLELISGNTAKGFSLVSKFMTYWDMLIRTYKAQSVTSSNDEQPQEPLIFILIDDADLKPQILNELVFGLPKFFSHPNVVVVVSASQKILNYTVKNYMFKQITGNEFDLTALMDIEYKHNYIDRNDNDDLRKLKFHELRYGREYDKIKNLTDEILRKLFPVCNRFYLRKYDRYDEKGLLNFENTEGKDVPISREFFRVISSFQKKVNKLHNSNIHKAINSKSEIENVLKNKNKNFKLINDSEKDISNPIYLSFLGRYPRDIVSSYYSLCDTLTELTRQLEIYYADNLINPEKTENFITGVYNTCINFISSVITSNRNLKPFCREAYDLILKQRLNYVLFVNYEMILNVMCKKEYFADNKDHPDYFMEMFCLLNFVEQLIFLVSPERKSHHGYAEFKQFLEKCGIHIIKQSNDLDKMLQQYYWFSSSNILDFNILNKFHIDTFFEIDKKYDLFGVNSDVRNLLEDREWYNFYTESAFYKYSKISIVESNKKQLFSIKPTDFVDEAYTTMYYKYYSQLHQWFTTVSDSKEHSRSSSSLFKAAEFIDNFSTMLHILNEDLYNLSIKFNSNSLADALGSFVMELSQSTGYYEMKRILNDFVQMLNKNEYTIPRFYVLDFLKEINNPYIFDDYSVGQYIFSWDRRLVRCLKENFSLVRNSTYNSYLEACSYINLHMDEYFDSMSLYYERTIQVPDNGNPLNDLMKNQYLYTYVLNLYEREWRRLRGLE